MKIVFLAVMITSAILFVLKFWASCYLLCMVSFLCYLWALEKEGA